MADEVANRAQGGLWESWAPSWIDSEAWTLVVGGDLGVQAIDALDPTAGWRVLDVGCGTGPTTVDLARRVAPDGSVLGVDIAPSMVDAARERARREEVPADFVVADAQVHDLGAEAFDGVFSRFGVMFFEEPDAAFANLRRSLRPGGRLGFVSWGDLFANEWMAIPGAAAIGASPVPPDLPAPGEPGPFSLAEPERIGEILEAAGFGDVVVTPSTHVVEVPEARLDDAVAASCGIGIVRLILESTPDAGAREAIRGAVRDALAARCADGALRLGAAANVVTATA